MHFRGFLVTLAAYTSSMLPLANAPVAQAEEASVRSFYRFETGLGLRFMPIGWFDLADMSNRTGFRAYPALGFAPFADYWLNHYVAVGISPEVTLNVIPNRAGYQTGEMLLVDARLQVRYPSQGHIEPYAIATGGYSTIWRSGASSARGPALGASLGVRAKFGVRQALFGDVSYQKGYQTVDGGAYGPRYVITGAGWQVAF